MTKNNKEQEKHPEIRYSVVAKATEGRNQDATIKLLGLQGVKILNLHYIKGENDEIKEGQILIEPLVPKQNCPCCGSSDVIKKGKNDNRKITHLKIAVGSTVEHAAALTQTPYSTVERFFKETAKLIPVQRIDHAIRDFTVAV